MERRTAEHPLANLSLRQDRIAYCVVDADGAVAYASFDKAAAREVADGLGADVSARAVEPRGVAARALGKLDGLESLCLAPGARDDRGDRIAYCLVTTGGGVDGRDHTDKGGHVRFATFEKGEAARKRDGWVRVEARVVVPAAVAAAAKGKLDPVEHLCLLGAADAPEPPAAPSFR